MFVEKLIEDARDHAVREAGLPGRADRNCECPSCDAAVRQPGQICDACLQAKQDEREAGWGR